MLSSLSIDLDNKWAYLKTAQHASWVGWPSYLPTVVPRIRSVMEEIGQKLTVFVVGRDLECAESVAQIRDLVFDGHEIANHSYEHEPWLHRFNDDRLKDEIDRTDALCRQALGVQPKGFRGPGFSDSPAVHRLLAERGYSYCASAFPSSVGPIARAMYMAKAGIRKGSAEHKKMFGSLTDMLNPNRPYRLLESDQSILWMIPVTVQPMTRIPIHFTYLFYLSQLSLGLARMHFRFSMLLCQLTRTPPSLLLHPLDFISASEEPELAFFPGMNMDFGRKRRQLVWFLAELQRRFEVVTMTEQVSSLTVARRSGCSSPGAKPEEPRSQEYLPAVEELVGKY